jgi:shikimate dehydrogenase
MDFALTGATKLYFIVGDPIAQVKAPDGVTRAFAARGHDGIVVPVHVAAADVAALLDVADRLQNLQGIIATVPHKFAGFAKCSSTTARAQFIGACNIMRRGPDGGWHGDMVDGLGFVGAMRAKGVEPQGKRALLVGAGGAGSAIAFALIDAGVPELAIHDTDTDRRNALIGRLNARGLGRVVVGTANPAGFDIVGNATPAGMRSDDPMPVDLGKLAPTSYVGCVVTVPALSPLVAAARAIGCTTATGTNMYQALQGAMVDFFLASVTPD